MTVLALHRRSMKSTNDGTASTLGPLEAIAVVLGTLLLMATISLGVMFMLNITRALLTLPCADWPICLVHY